MGYRDRIIQIVAIRKQRRVTVKPSEDKVLLEPSHVADLPLHGIDNRELWSDELLSIQALQQLQCAGAGITKDLYQIGGGDGLSHMISA